MHVHMHMHMCMCISRRVVHSTCSLLPIHYFRAPKAQSASNPAGWIARGVRQKCGAVLRLVCQTSRIARRGRHRQRQRTRLASKKRASCASKCSQPSPGPREACDGNRQCKLLELAHRILNTLSSGRTRQGRQPDVRSSAGFAAAPQARSTAACACMVARCSLRPNKSATQPRCVGHTSPGPNKVRDKQYSAFRGRPASRKMGWDDDSSIGGVLK